MTMQTTTQNWQIADIGRLPADWRVVKLRDHLERTEPIDPSKKPNDEFVYVDVSSVSRDFFKIVAVQKLFGKDAPSRARKLVQTGDIIFATVRPTLQRIAMISDEFNNQICSTGYCVLRTRSTSLNRDFLFHYLCTDIVLKYVEEMQGGASYPAISDRVLFDMNIPFPPLKEQKAIARVLTTVQDAIAGQEAMIAKLKELKRSMMNHLFTHGTCGEKTKITEIGEVPESWDVVELKEVCEKPQYGFTDSASQKGNVRFLRITDITEDGVDWPSVPFCNCPEPEKYWLKDGDIVFARIGATTGKSYFLKSPDNAVYASYLIRVRATQINSEYLYYYFQTDAYWKQINSQKGTNLKGGVNDSILSQLLVPKCDAKEQIIIAITFKSIDAKIVAVQAKLSNYQSLFKTLLHELMSGERRLKH